MSKRQRQHGSAKASRGDPPQAAAQLYNEGVRLAGGGRLDEAAEAYRRALELAPEFVEAHCNLGLIEAGRQRLAEAERHLRQALRIRPDDPLVLNNLGQILTRRNNTDQAERVLRQALRRAPGQPMLLTNLGNCLRLQEHLSEAEAAYREALSAAPELEEACANLGGVLEQQGRANEAIALLEGGLARHPGSLQILTNLGNAQLAAGDVAAAIATQRQVIALAPRHAAGHWNLALALLLDGQLAEGWKEYEWRWAEHGQHLRVVDDEARRWDGSPLAGRTLLLWTEQGFGDAIQFIRFAAALQGGRVILQCQPALGRLLATAPGIAEVHALAGPTPAFDLHLPLLSLPHLLGITLDNLPARVPYLAPPAEHPGFDFPADRLNVGVVWSGGDKFARWRDKAIDMARFKRLFEVPGCAFHSLQVGPREKDLKVHRLGGRVQALGGGLKDFADTAAAIQGLDLVISVDTAVCHLAGALGRPVWTLLPHSADFRWLRQRQDSPWYPGMRLFRQPVPGDWDSVLEAVRAALAARVTAGD